MTNVTLVDLSKLNPEERLAWLMIALKSYTGERCKFCHHLFTSAKDLRDRHAVYAGEHAHGRVACRACWDVYGTPAPEIADE